MLASNKSTNFRDAANPWGIRGQTTAHRSDGEEEPREVTCEKGVSNEVPTLTDIMAQQATERIHASSRNGSNEDDEERMIRMAIEASLRCDKQEPIEDQKLSALDLVQTTEESEEDSHLRLAIEESLRLSSTTESNPTLSAFACEIQNETMVDIKISAQLDMVTSHMSTKELEELERAMREIVDNEQKEEAASIELARLLQEQEDSDGVIFLAKSDASVSTGAAASLAGLHHVGVRTMQRDDFERLKGKSRGSEKYIQPAEFSNYYADVDDSYYYEDDEGFRINSSSLKPTSSTGITPARANKGSGWVRSVGSNKIVGGTGGQEIRTKHDVQLKNISNARRLGLTDAGASVSDRAYNALKSKINKKVIKGVTVSGTGRAENMTMDRTRQGALDGTVLLEIQRAITNGIISHMNGAVKEGKEALVYHADGPLTNDMLAQDAVQHTSQDVAIKIFKRIQEFKQRGQYVDGDPRYRQKFGSHNKREQVELWTEKEYRNLARCFRNGIPCPKPILYKQNILFMSFLGEDGWPAPQLREVDIKHSSKKWTHFYCEAMMAVRKLYHCACLVHGDLSEYNILLVPSYLLQDADRPKNDSLSSSRIDNGDVQIVLIDFGQAIHTGHPSADMFLERDVHRLSSFFSSQGVNVLSPEKIKEYIMASCGPTKTEINETDLDEKKPRCTILNWDDDKEYDKLSHMIDN